MVLEAVGGETEESIDEPIVADNRQKSLFVVECVGADQFWRRIGISMVTRSLRGRIRLTFTRLKR